MGIERARVVEVDADGRVGAGYVIGDRLVLTGGRRKPKAVRPASTATWMPSSLVWRAPSGDAAVLEIDDPAALMLPADGMRWGRVTGSRPVAVTAMGFAPSDGPATWPRDATQFLGHLVPADGDAAPAVRATVAPGEGMAGASLFAGAELVGVLVVDAGRSRAVPIAALAEEAAFVDLFADDDADGLVLVPVTTPASAFPMLAG
jgi:hypothetical protein